MTRVGRPLTCECGTCPKCVRRVKAREAYQAMTVEERRAWVARRDAQRVRAADRVRYRGDQPKKRLTVNTRRWRDENPEKRRAQQTVAKAIRKGELVRQPCEEGPEGCGPGKVHAHHDDYSKPLDVRWLCARHHAGVRRGA